MAELSDRQVSCEPDKLMRQEQKKLSYLSYIINVGPILLTIWMALNIIICILVL